MLNMRFTLIELGRYMSSGKMDVVSAKLTLFARIAIVLLIFVGGNALIIFSSHFVPVEYARLWIAILGALDWILTWAIWNKLSRKQ